MIFTARCLVIATGEDKAAGRGFDRIRQKEDGLGR